MSRLVSFRRMEDGTREDYLLLDESERRYAQGLADRVLESMRKLDHSLFGYRVTRLQHSLQTATRALRDGADDELVFAALLHDIGDEIAPYNHSEMAAAIVRPYVRPEVAWIVEHHGLFQNYYYVHHLGGDRHARDRLRDHPWYAACVHFCAAWDQCSFDPDYGHESLEFFTPLVRRMLARTPQDPRYQTAPI
ncbi:MAG TPA: HD domain-containing protein [Steroidobacteraceae bacterium]|nr:HD domain-containing protein [Steroidobacteraceae bacterium]